MEQSQGLVTFATLITILTIDTWINDNLCYLAINCDTGQNSQFLQCFVLFSSISEKLQFTVSLDHPVL